MSLVSRLIDAGTPSNLVEEVAMLLAEKRVAEKAITERREKDAERQARRREREAGHVTSRDKTGQHVTERDPSLSPAPNENNSNPHPHTHPEGVTPCAREANPFPRPAWCPSPLWNDFLANRKAKRLKNTATAYRGFLSDIDRLTDDEWPPPRLLEHATAKGWGAIYDPREKRHDRPSASNDEIQNPYARVAARRQAERAAAIR